MESGGNILHTGRIFEMPDETVPCKFHGGLARALENVDNRTESVKSKVEEIQNTVTAQGVYSKEHQRQLEALFQTTGAIKAAVDQNIAHAGYRDKQLEEIKGITEALTEAIETVQVTVENGLNARVEVLSTTIHGEDGLANKVDSLSDAIHGAEGLVKQVEKMAGAVSMLAGCMQRRKLEAEQKAAEEAEFSAYKKFGKAIARNLTRLWKENTVLVILFATWLLFAEGGIGYKIHLILSFLGVMK